MLRFSHGLAEYQTSAYESKSKSQKVDALLGAAVVLGNKIKVKVGTLPQTCYDTVIGIDRHGQDSYGVDNDIGGENAPLATILGCPELSRANQVKKTYGGMIGLGVGKLGGAMLAWAAGLHAAVGSGAAVTAPGHAIAATQAASWLTTTYCGMTGAYLGAKAQIGVEKTPSILY